MSQDTLTIRDDRTGKTYTVPLRYGSDPSLGAAIDAKDLKQIRSSDQDYGVMSYDPGLANTATCESRITCLNGEEGVLRHRGYAIEQLADQSSFLEVAYLLIYGSLPRQHQLEAWAKDITGHALIHESIKTFMEGFNYDAHTMAMMVSVMGALSTFYPDARNISCQRFFPGEPEVCDIGSMEVHVKRLIGTVPKVAACSYRHSRGLPYIYPREGLSYTGNLLHMLFGTLDAPPDVDEHLERALDTLFIIHAEHGQNCSTTAMRCIGSTQADPYACMAGAAAALYGPLHGGADEAVIAMLQEIGTRDRIPGYLEKVKVREAPLPGFGHRLYKGRDPRVAIIKRVADDMFGERGPSDLMQLALEVERVTSEDEFFVSRNLYPNTEFYSGILYESMGLPLDMMCVLFAIPRTVGWLANWREGLTDESQRIYRPQHIYTGPEAREYVPIDQRG